MLLETKLLRIGFSLELDWNDTVFNTSITFIYVPTIMAFLSPLRTLWKILHWIFFSKRWILSCLIWHLIRLMDVASVLRCIPLGNLPKTILSFSQIPGEVDTFGCRPHHWCLLISCNILLDRLLQSFSLSLDAWGHLLSQLSVYLKVLDLKLAIAIFLRVYKLRRHSKLKLALNDLASMGHTFVKLFVRLGDVWKGILLQFMLWICCWVFLLERGAWNTDRASSVLVVHQCRFEDNLVEYALLAPIVLHRGKNIVVWRKGLLDRVVHFWGPVVITSNYRGWLCRLRVDWIDTGLFVHGQRGPLLVDRRHPLVIGWDHAVVHVTCSLQIARILSTVVSLSCPKLVAWLSTHCRSSLLVDDHLWWTVSSYRDLGAGRVFLDFYAPDTNHLVGVLARGSRTLHLSCVLVCWRIAQGNFFWANDLCLWGIFGETALSHSLRLAQLRATSDSFYRLLASLVEALRNSDVSLDGMLTLLAIATFFRSPSFQKLWARIVNTVCFASWSIWLSVSSK